MSSRSFTPLVLGFAGFVAASSPSPAAAHGLERVANGDHLLVGLDLGHTARLGTSDETSLLGGFEVSWVRMRDFFWAGFLTELRYEGTSQSAFVALGAEGGWLFAGGDLSLIARLGPSSAFGARARACFTLAYVSGCGGAAIMTRGSFIELTASVKVPVEWAPRFLRRRE